MRNIIAMLLFLASCGGEVDRENKCASASSELRPPPSITLEVYDKNTSKRVCEAEVDITPPGKGSPVRVPGASGAACNSYSVIIGSAGEYAVEITAPGYRFYTQRIQVSSRPDECVGELVDSYWERVFLQATR